MYFVLHRLIESLVKTCKDFCNALKALYFVAVKEGVSKEDAEAAKAKLEEVGAKVELK